MLVQKSETKVIFSVNEKYILMKKKCNKTKKIKVAKKWH